MRFVQRSVVVLAFLIQSWASGALAGPCDEPMGEAPSTLKALLAACRVQAVPGDRTLLSREISDYAFEDDADLFWVAFYWKDEGESHSLPARLNVLLLDRTSGVWRQRSLDRESLPRTALTPEGAGVGSVHRLHHGAGSLYADTHSNPSAGGLIVLARDLEPRAVLSGWYLFTLPGGALVYHRSQIHFAPTHPLELGLYDPETGSDRVFYPSKPYDAPRAAFIAKMKAAYESLGFDWCRNRNHHCDPEQFTSSWQDAWSVNPDAGTAAFLVEFGDPSGGSPDADTSVPQVRVVVVCRGITTPYHMTCTEHAPSPRH